MSEYTTDYGATYGSGGYPLSFLDVQADIYLGSSLGWTSITQWLYLRNPTSIRRGRPDESSSAQPSQASLTLDNRTNRFTIRNPEGPWYGLLRQNTPLRLSVPAYVAALPNYLRFADDTVSYASAPDAAGLDITGDIELQLDLWLDSWMPCVLASKDDADTQRSWSWRLNGDGTLAFHWFDSGSGGHIATSTAPMPAGRISLRVTLAVASGTVTFWTSATPVDASPSWTQLGDTTVAGATSVFDSTTAVLVGANAAITALDASGQVTTIGPLGMFFGFELLNGIGGTVAASPDFTMQGAGTAPFADGQGNTWTPAGTSEISDRLYRFHGELGSMPKAADPSGRDVYSQATADGVLRRLQQGSSPADSVMVRSVTSYPSVPSGSTGTGQATIGYWSCEDGQGSASFASSIAQNADGLVPQPMQFSGVPSIQAQTGSPQADSVFACSGQLPQVQQSRWTAAVPPYDYPQSSAFTLLFLLAIPSGGISADADLLGAVFALAGVTNTLSVSYTTASGGSITLTGPGGTTGPATGVNGNAYWVALSNVGTGTELAELRLLEVGGDTVTLLSIGSDGGGLTAFTVNPGQANLGETEIGQFWVSAQYSTGGIAVAAPDIGALWQIAAAWAGETDAARVYRLAGENSLGCRIVGPPDTGVAMGAQLIDTLANLFSYCEQTGMGMLFEPRTAVGIAYRTLSSLCNQDPAATADYTAKQVQKGFGSTADDQLVVNYVTAQAADGSSARAVLQTGAMSVLPPPDGIGDVDTSITVYPENDDQLPDLAGWYLHVRTADDDRYPSIPFQMARPETPQAVALLDIGDYLKITDTPAWEPPPPVRQLCAGYNEQLGPARLWPLNVNGIPEVPYETLVFGTGATDSGHFDTSGSTLESGVSATATSLSVATTGANAALWTTNGADFPFDISIAGERMTVTDITGGSSPQPFTVTRSVNGVVKAQDSGAAVSLWDTPIFALAGVS